MYKYIFFRKPEGQPDPSIDFGAVTQMELPGLGQKTNKVISVANQSCVLATV